MNLGIEHITLVDSTLSEVKQIIKENLGLSNLPKDNDKIRADLGADSLDAVELIMEFEDHFKITIPDEEVSKDYTVKEVSNIIDELIKEQSKNVVSKSFEDYYIDVINTTHDFDICFRTLNNVLDICNHINKFGITDENKALFASSFENIGLTYSKETITSVVKNVISRFREMILTLIQKIKLFFAKFMNNSRARIRVIEKKINDIKMSEYMKRFVNSASAQNFKIHFLNTIKLKQYIDDTKSSWTELSKEFVGEEIGDVVHWYDTAEKALAKYKEDVKIIELKEEELRKEAEVLHKELDEVFKKHPFENEPEGTTAAEYAHNVIKNAGLSDRVDALKEKQQRCTRVIYFVTMFGGTIEKDVDAINELAKKLAHQAV